MHAFDLIIVGGGLAGASLAAALRQSRLRIALVEGQPPSPPAGWDARIYAISPANAAFLADIGAWEHLDPARRAPVRRMRVFGDRGGRLDFSAFATGVEELAWMLEASQMAGELWEGIKRQANVSRFCPARPAALALRDEAVELTLEDGQKLSARLLVGADGRDSWVRNAAGLAAHDTPYGEKGVVANFVTEKPHHDSAWQWFLPDSVLAYLPLPGRRMSIVWSLPEAAADALVAAPPEALAAQVERAGGGVLGRLETLTPATAFALRLIRVPRRVLPRLALIGDAAHGIHPLSGHGINLGFQDARVLAELLGGAPPWQDIGELRLLERYARARAEETLLLQSATHALRHLFRARLPGLAPLRNLGLSLTDRLGPCKTLLTRYALGAL